MTHIEIVGSVAAFFTTIAFVPQVIQTWKSKHARDLSLGMFSMFTTGVVLWLIYGLLIGSWPADWLMADHYCQYRHGGSGWDDFVFQVALWLKLGSARLRSQASTRLETSSRFMSGSRK